MYIVVRETRSANAPGSIEEIRPALSTLGLELVHSTQIRYSVNNLVKYWKVPLTIFVMYGLSTKLLAQVNSSVELLTGRSDWEHSRMLVGGWLGCSIVCNACVSVRWTQRVAYRTVRLEKTGDKTLLDRAVSNEIVSSTLPGLAGSGGDKQSGGVFHCNKVGGNVCERQSLAKVVRLFDRCHKATKREERERAAGQCQEPQPYPQDVRDMTTHLFLRMT